MDVGGTADGSPEAGAEDVPERASRFDRIRLWLYAFGTPLVMVAASTALAIAMSHPDATDECTGSECDGTGAGWLLVVLVVAYGAAFAFVEGRRARSLSSAPGRFAFVVERRDVPRTAPLRWRRRSLLFHAGHWFHLVSIDEEDLGWVEVSLRNSFRLRRARVCAAWGKGRSMVLTGPFRPMPVRAVETEVPEDPGWNGYFYLRYGFSRERLRKLRR